MKEGASSVLLFILKPFPCSEHSNTEAVVLALPNSRNEEKWLFFWISEEVQSLHLAEFVTSVFDSLQLSFLFSFIFLLSFSFFFVFKTEFLCDMP